MKFQHQSRYHNSSENERKIFFNHPDLHLVNINAYTKFDWNPKLIHKILCINKILMSIKGHDFVKNWPKIMCIRHNMEFVYINAYTKFYHHPFVLKMLRKNTFLHQSRAITLLLTNKFSPFAIPNHSSLISMPMQSLKKIVKNYSS